MIVITGGTGRLGSQVLDRLLERAPAEQIALSVRDPHRARGAAERGVRVRRGDFGQPETLAAAFEGASQVLVVSVDAVGGEGVALSTAAIDAAYRAGAQQVLYTSHQAADQGSAWVTARHHAAVEAHLEECGRPFTVLRNGYHTSSLGFHVGGSVQTGEIRAPADGPMSWTARADLAEAAAAILAGEDRFDGATPPLTAAESVDLETVAVMLSEQSGRTVRRVVVDDQGQAWWIEHF